VRSRFYAELMGNSKTVTRTGTRDSGLWAHLRGHDIGVNVRMYVNEHGEDELSVHLTGGSNAPNDLKLVTVDSHGNETLVSPEKEFKLILRKPGPIVLATDR